MYMANGGQAANELKTVEINGFLGVIKRTG